MHKPNHSRTRGTIAALAITMTALAVASLTAPPLSGLAALALTLGVAALVVVARAEAVAR